ncbi:MAG: FAD-binding oxidoreductase [Bacteroidota bacterium]
MISEFLQDCQKVSGVSQVMHESQTLARYHASISGEQRRIAGCVRPGSVAEVQEIVRLANRYRTPIYPISTGKNWGLGSALPVRDGAVILDLGRLNKIREVNTRYGYAVIEPGVTQQQLYNYLQEKQLPYALDLTGSAAESSIIGNILEGGLGFCGLRFEQSSGFEVVLADGTLLQTGYGHFENPLLQHLYRYGVGPFVDGLFVQSSFGIVTAAGISLSPLLEKQTSVICSLKEEKDFMRYVDNLGELHRKGIVHNNIKIANYHRSKTMLCPPIYKRLKEISPAGTSVSREMIEKIFKDNFGPWSTVIPVKGDRRYVRLVHRQIKEALGGIAKIRVIDKDRLAFLKKLTGIFHPIPFFRYQHAVVCAIEPLFNLSRGVPSSATLQSLYWPTLEVPEDYRYPDTHANVGMIGYLPVIPMDGKTMVHVRDVITSSFESRGFLPNITLNIVSHKAVLGVIDMPFDRSNPDTLRRAKQCIADVTRSLLPEGIIPQRVGIDYMAELIQSDDPYWKLVAKLKSSLDPNGILSPGRYHS